MTNLKLAQTVSIVILLASFLSNAQIASPVKVRVIKSKGKTSLVRIPNSYNGELPVGVYNLTAVAEADNTITEDPRDRLVSISFESTFSSRTTTVGTTETKTDTKSMAANLTYGWNKKSFEFGPFLNYEFQTEGALDAKALSAGLFVDWNFIPNVEGKSWVPGLRLLAGLGQVDNSALAKAYSSTLTQAGLVVKYFNFHSSFAVTGEIALRMESASPENSKIKSTTTLARLGLINYF
jgi:hypothetical protein